MQKIILILFVGILGVLGVNQTKETLTVTNDVVLENVEALADMEVPGPTYCKGEGNVTCPINEFKCAYVFIGYSLR